MNIKSVFSFFKEWIVISIQFISTFFMTSTAKNFEIIALRSQLSLFQQQVENKKISKPRCTPVFRQLWVLLSKVFINWKSNLILVKPETVIRWHETAFKFHWKSKSKKTGRPTIPTETIKLIKKIHKENPLLSPEKIREVLISMNVINPPAPNTIAKYISYTRKPPSERQVQSWKTFLKNHSKEIWAMDFFTVPTLLFKVLYVLIIINHGTRKIEHFAVTCNPNLKWLKQQIRNATPYDHKPQYLIHDNNPVFVSKDFKTFLASSGIRSKRISKRSPWQNGIAERSIGIIRQELLNYIIPFNEKHLHRLLREYIHEYYNTHRTHQGINGKTPIPLPTYLPTKASKTKLKATPVLGGLYHTYKKVA
ncbi:Integrase, catalytic region [Desulforamulus reducens MI-1]|uniref:Integrase, catalytic region n=1 Tax=Desulforamulus reducens (strain ATCC BAA-1160 / DSM 100696 / MI-1) TaxID=349161 RepID=A4J8X5_DESRM|nr:integrase core domain-containing protein [Desulforamulus reducens]ABO51528.1 Integrase, catalytic region [Desulforamulus reducens MI-1]